MGTRPVATERILWRLWLGAPVALALLAGASFVAGGPVGIVIARVAVWFVPAYAIVRDRIDVDRRAATGPRRVLLATTEAGLVVAAGLILLMIGGAFVLAVGCSAFGCDLD